MGENSCYHRLCRRFDIKALESRYENVGFTQNNFKSQIDATFIGEDYFRPYAVRFVVAQFIARPAGRSLAGKPPAVLFCVETGNKWDKTRSRRFDD